MGSVIICGCITSFGYHDQFFFRNDLTRQILVVGGFSRASITRDIGSGYSGVHISMYSRSLSITLTVYFPISDIFVHREKLRMQSAVNLF